MPISVQSRGLGLVAPLLLCLGLAACSGNAASTPGGGGSGAATPGAASVAPAEASVAPAAESGTAPASGSSVGAGPAASDMALDVCAIFPVSAAAKASGLNLTSAVADLGGSGQYGCTYSSDGTTAVDLENNPDVTVYTSASPLTLDGLKAGLDASASQNAPTVAISGVGDKAYAGADGIIAQSGSHIVEVSGLATDLSGNHVASSAIANALLAALPGS